MGAQYPNIDVVTFAYDGSIVVDIDDLMYHDTNDVKPASSQADQGSEAANQAAFVPKFAGVAKERKLSDSAAGTLDVITDWVGEMPCDSSTFEVGDMLTIDEAASGTALEDQKLVKTTDPSLAIGYVLTRYASATTTVLCRLLSNVTPPNMLGTGAITPTTVVASTSVTTPVVVMSGATGVPEIRLTTNLADALSIEDTAGDLIKIDTTTGAQLITITPATTITGALTASTSVTTPVVIMTGTTGNQEVRLTTNLADALSIEDTAGDLVVFDTTTGAQVITVTPAVTVTGALTANGGATIANLLKLEAGTVAAAGSVQGNAGTIDDSAIVWAVTAGDDTKGVVLPTAVAGAVKIILNSGSAGLKIYPADADKINNGSANAAITILENTMAILVATAADNWAAVYTANS